MYGAIPYLMARFALDRETAFRVVCDWVDGQAAGRRGRAASGAARPVGLRSRRSAVLAGAVGPEDVRAGAWTALQDKELARGTALAFGRGAVSSVPVEATMKPASSRVRCCRVHAGRVALAGQQVSADVCVPAVRSRATWWWAMDTPPIIAARARAVVVSSSGAPRGRGRGRAGAPPSRTRLLAAPWVPSGHPVLRRWPLLRPADPAAVRRARGHRSTSATAGTTRTATSTTATATTPRRHDGHDHGTGTTDLSRAFPAHDLSDPGGSFQSRYPRPRAGISFFPPRPRVTRASRGAA